MQEHKRTRKGRVSRPAEVRRPREQLGEKRGNWTDLMSYLQFLESSDPQNPMERDRDRGSNDLERRGSIWESVHNYRNSLLRNPITRVNFFAR